MSLSDRRADLGRTLHDFLFRALGILFVIVALVGILFAFMGLVKIFLITLWLTIKVALWGITAGGAILIAMACFGEARSKTSTKRRFSPANVHPVRDDMIDTGPQA